MIVKTSGNRLCHGGRIDHTAEPARCSRSADRTPPGAGSADHRCDGPAACGVCAPACPMACPCGASCHESAAPAPSSRARRRAVCETCRSAPRRAQPSTACSSRAGPQRPWRHTHTRATGVPAAAPGVARRCPAPPTAHRRRATAQTRDGAERLGPISRHGAREDAHTWVPARVSPLLASAPLWFGSGSSGAVEGSSLDGLLLDGQLLGHGAVEHLQPAARAAADARVQLRLGSLHVEK